MKRAASKGKFIRALQNVGPKNMIGKDHLEDLDVDGILKYIKTELM